MLLGRRGSVHSSTPVSSSLALSAGGLTNGITTAAPHQQQTQHQQQQQQQSLSEPNSSDGDALHMKIHSPSNRPARTRDLPTTAQRLGGHLSAANLISPMGVPFTAPITTSAGMVLPMATTRSVNSNDQNPPCNTLYVGNLPPSAKEEELRQMFRGSIGYKRMSFRSKPNSGPMCFVEFESIDFATLAMNELDGRMLTTSVGSGIRLSYSKNPLGIRSQNNPNNLSGVSSATLNSAAMAAAAAAMAGGYGAINGSSYGYSLSALHTQIAQEQPQQQQPQQQQTQFREVIPASSNTFTAHQRASC
ncbi:cell cycle RNA binding protein whi3 [Coemansia sp. RSA 2049]|nr:cell cycle RNA binding protein whi3 [Coemansia sp. RSA 2049]